MRQDIKRKLIIATAIIAGLTAASAVPVQALSNSYVYHTGSNYAHAYYSGSVGKSDAQQGTASYRQGAMSLCRRANGGQQWYYAGNITGVNQGTSTYDCDNNGTYNVALDDNWSYESVA